MKCPLCNERPASPRFNYLCWLCWANEPSRPKARPEPDEDDPPAKDATYIPGRAPVVLTPVRIWPEEIGERDER